MKIHNWDGETKEMQVGQIGYLQINTGRVYEEYSSYYSRCMVKVICRTHPVWVDNLKTDKTFLEIVKD